MTTIKSRESGKTYEIKLGNPDCVADILAGYGFPAGEGNVHMVPTDEDVEWWADWAERTERVEMDACEYLDGPELVEFFELGGKYADDLGALLDAQERFVWSATQGIERD